MINAVDLPTVTYYQVLGMVHSQPNPLLVQLLYTLYITFSFLAVKMQKKNNPECHLFVYKKCPSNKFFFVFDPILTKLCKIVVLMSTRLLMMKYGI